MLLVIVIPDTTVNVKGESYEAADAPPPDGLVVNAPTTKFTIAKASRATIKPITP